MYVMSNRAHSDKISLINHKRKHSSERPYVCDVCNEAFSHNGGLIRHNRKHSGERHYVCDVYNKAYG